MNSKNRVNRATARRVPGRQHRYATVALPVLILFCLTANIPAQPAPFTLTQVMGFSFPDNLVAGPVGGQIAWAANTRGQRNVMVAEAPRYQPKRVTNYLEDDGQELSGLQWTPDGKRLVYVRGGDAFGPPGSTLPNPQNRPAGGEQTVWIVDAGGGEPQRLGEGQSPAISSDGKRVAFLSAGNLWIAPLDGRGKAAKAVALRGACRSPRWSPDGAQLAFVTDRGDHSFIALFRAANDPIRYLAPSVDRDDEPT